MGSKQRISIVVGLMSLTFMLLFFQNCSPSGSLYGDGEEDSFLVDPPQVFATKSPLCTQPATVFNATDPIYICVKNAGKAPIYCHTLAGASTGCTRITISQANGWTSRNSDWYKLFSTATGNAFGAGYSFTSYVIHTDDPTLVGQATFTVNQQ